MAYKMDSGEINSQVMLGLSLLAVGCLGVGLGNS